jgi:hypothetical protein
MIFPYPLKGKQILHHRYIFIVQGEEMNRVDFMNPIQQF